MGICIVTGQPLANLIPLLQEKPGRVALVVSTDMQREAERFRAVLFEAGWSEAQVDRYVDLPDNHFDDIFRKAEAIKTDLHKRYASAEIVYNATGGNKLMALAFHAVFSRDGHRVIYTDTRHGRLETLHPRTADAMPLRSVLTLNLYLKAAGKTLFRCRSDDQSWLNGARKREKATRFLAEKLSRIGPLINKFNWFAYNAQNDKVPSPLRLKHPPRGDWSTALRYLVNADVLDACEDDSQTWYPRSSDAIGYLGGGWLEEYVWITAVNAGAECAAMGVEITDDYSEKGDLLNEIDVAILHNNRLLLVECKTGNIHRDGKDSDIIYKLDSLASQAGGALGERLLVSARELEHTTSDGKMVNTRARAGSHSIHTCECSELIRLGDSLKFWLQSGKWQAKGKR